MTNQLEFDTPLSVAQCHERLAHETRYRSPNWHRIDVHEDGSFVVARNVNIMSILRGARSQQITLRWQGTITADGAASRVSGHPHRSTRLRLMLEKWRFPWIILLLVALLPIHAYKTVVVTLLVLVLPLMLVSWWRWWKLQRQVRALTNTLRDALQGKQ